MRLLLTAMLYLTANLDFNTVVLLLVLVVLLLVLVVLLGEAKATRQSIGELRQSIGQISATLKWLLLATPERLDFWHPRQKHIAAPYSRPKKLKEKLAKHYFGGSNPQTECAVTGLPASTNKEDDKTHSVVIAHLLPRNSPDIAYAHFGLDPKEARDGMRMCMFLCKTIEDAYDRKKLSFYQVGKADGKTMFKMKLWDPTVGDQLVYGDTAANVPKIQQYADTQFSFPDKKTPFTRILSYHHWVCHYSAEKRGWNADGNPPNTFGSPLEDPNIPTEIYGEFSLHAEDEKSFATPSPGKRRNILFQSSSLSTASPSAASSSY